jgi:outer membrane protein TolC
VILLNIRLNLKNRCVLGVYSLVFLLSLVCHRAQATVLQYSELSNLVKAKNLHVKASEEALLSSEWKEGHLVRSFLPRVSAEAGYEMFQRELFTKNTQPYGAIQAEINLFNGVKDFLEEKIRKEESRIGQATSEQMFREELLKAQIVFWQFVFLSEEHKLLESYAGRNAKNLNSARRRISAGSATASDEMEFEMTTRLIEQDISKARTQLANAKQQLNVLIGKEPGEEISISETLPKPVDFEFESKTIESKSLPEVVMAQAASNVARYKRNQEILWWTPRLDVYSGFRQMNMRESDEFSLLDRQEFVAGLKLSINIFDGGEAFSENRSQAAMARSLESKAIQSFRELSVEFENSKSELKQLSEQVNAASKDVEMAERFLSRILSEYSRGVKSSSEVLSASDRSFEFQKRYAELRRDYQVSKAKLLSLLSKEGEK